MRSEKFWSSQRAWIVLKSGKELYLKKFFFSESSFSVYVSVLWFHLKVDAIFHAWSSPDQLVNCRFAREAWFCWGLGNLRLGSRVSAISLSYHSKKLLWIPSDGNLSL